MIILSLFDGMACGRIALERAGIHPKAYFSSEIDNYASLVAARNWPAIFPLGDVLNVRAVNLPRIDLLMGGSPCQGFSYAGKGLNFNDPRSALFFEYVRILKECDPTYFLYENVKMKSEYRDIITKYLGVQPVRINSALVSAQNRVRDYWTNIPFDGLPLDRKIFLKDIIENGITNREKSYCIKANYAGGTSGLNTYFNRRSQQLIFFVGRGKNPPGFRAFDGKVNTLTASRWEQNNFLASIKGCRKLTPVECERLQTVPDNYTNHVSNTQRYKMLGNGWTVDIIAYILKGIK